MLPRLPLLPPPPTCPAFDGSPASACCVIYTPQHHPTNAAIDTPIIDNKTFVAIIYLFCVEDKQNNKDDNS